MEYNYRKHASVSVLAASRDSSVRSRVPTRQSTRLSATSANSKSATGTSRQKNTSSTKIDDRKPRKQEVEELYKMSYPCHTNDCCYCAYTKCLGPVKIFITQHTRSSRRWNQTQALAKKDNTLCGNENRIESSVRKQLQKPESVRNVTDKRTATRPKKSISWK